MTDSNTGAFTSGFGWPAPAKLNLFLHITGRRSDGYHQLQTVFQFLDYCDRLYFTPRGDAQIQRLNNPANIDADHDLVVRAARAIQRASGCPLGADIRIEKHIPLGGGLGGGSSNAATTLVALNRLWNTGFTPDELAAIGVGLGADVPVFVRGVAAWAEGVGERLSRLDLPEPWYVIIVPPVLVSTAEIYAAPELQRNCPPISAEDFLNGHVTHNVLEPVTIARHPPVGDALQWLRQFGDARMSGSGAAVFLACADREGADEIADRVPSRWVRFVARGCNRSPLRSAASR
ncbi:4-(cytidine 5'-diphospho)-2-C-methyl-D-erythritol kinase [Sinimarinibacterium sp. NLF-5-8]|uniref:4-(cytidine 5'-diphospho)-2-C-methyl-D-erythritol kinase n=1 Tax=Sinimarinibacterium sp. NLF-5-8 TaxID=2698684 RepID=UPI00137C2E4A|nr:4-(cytidine 5'-diphospho)-2-C-methyl-D-erythritol kinase [Sinimarinibacterium sp. NLF-5-8]QHS10187.1 4-(cytidine 5'-diphospho)-2-C-methyl-D-erythritol kinase [Sinimarinibacterium sp. NLF-5-8]